MDIFLYQENKHFDEYDMKLYKRATRTPMQNVAEASSFPFRTPDEIIIIKL